MPNQSGWAVTTVAKWIPTVIRTFEVNRNGSNLPDSIQSPVQFKMAVWYAQYVAHHQMYPPSARQERGRRRRYMKSALTLLRQHDATKQTLAHIPPVSPPPPKKAPMPHGTFVIVYDPFNRVGDTTFKVHTSSCDRLDHDRRKAVRKNGSSWIVEGNTPQEVIAAQIKEFDQEQMEYDESDFAIHECQAEDK